MIINNDKIYKNIVTYFITECKIMELIFIENSYIIM
jgi:hypothetical protein